MTNRFFKGAVCGAIAGTAVVVGAVAVAGNGVGGILNLGQTNTVDAQSTLTGNAGTSAQLKVWNTGTGRAVSVQSDQTQALYGHGEIGVLGNSNSGAGVVGRSTNGIGVDGDGIFGVGGRSHDKSHAGVVARNDAGGTAVLGETSGGGTAVEGDAPDGNAVLGISQTGQGVYGKSSSNVGVSASAAGATAVGGFTHSATAAGVSGQGGGVGVAGVGGIGIYGKGLSSGYAFQAVGDALQNRGQSGWIKAAALINPQDVNDPVKQCYNAYAEVRSAGDCSISWHPGTVDNTPGYSLIDFGFSIEDRFVSITPMASGAGGDIAAQVIRGGQGSRIYVETFYAAKQDVDTFATSTWSPFMIIVY